jgi:hypothetical protein
MRDQDLYDKLLTPEDAPDTVDLSVLPGQKECEQIAAEVRAVRTGLGITRLQADETLQFVAVTRGADWASDDAYIRFLSAHPEIAEESFAPQVFTLLGSTAASFGSLEEAAEDLALRLLQSCADLSQRSRADCDLLLKGLDQPPDTEILPGITVASARVVFGEALKVRELQANLAEDREDRAHRLREHVAGELAEAQDDLDEESAIARLRLAALRDDPLPPPGKDKNKGKRAGNGKPRSPARSKGGPP